MDWDQSQPHLEGNILFFFRKLRQKPSYGGQTSSQQRETEDYSSSQGASGTPTLSPWGETHEALCRDENDTQLAPRKLTAMHQAGRTEEEHQSLRGFCLPQLGRENTKHRCSALCGVMLRYPCPYCLQAQQPGFQLLRVHFVASGSWLTSREFSLPGSCPQTEIEGCWDTSTPAP